MDTSELMEHFFNLGSEELIALSANDEEIQHLAESFGISVPELNISIQLMISSRVMVSGLKVIEESLEKIFNGPAPAESETKFQVGDKVLVHMLPGPGHSESYYAEGTIQEYLGKEDIYDHRAGADAYIRERYVVKLSNGQTTQNEDHIFPMTR